MAAMKTVLDLLVDANVILVLAFCLWRGAQSSILRSRLRHDYGLQLLLLKAVLLITVASPLIAHVAASVSQNLSPKTPITLSDIAVASYLRGEIGLPAIQFEALLNTRSRLIDGFLDSQALWAVGAKGTIVALVVLFALRTLWAFWRVRRALQGSFLWRRTRGVDIHVSDTVGIPFAARGLFRRHVVLPSGLMTHPVELRLVLAHEFQHLRSGDVEWEVAIEIVRPLMFWNPVFGLWKRSFDHLREMSCDQRVILSRGIAPRDYARCLLDFCESRIAGRWPMAMNVALVRSDASSSRRAFENRIRAMYHRPAGGGGGQVTGLILVLGVAVSLAALSVRQPGDWSHDRLMLSTVVNLERLEAINGGF